MRSLALVTFAQILFAAFVGNHSEVTDCTTRRGRCQANGTDQAMRRPHSQTDHSGQAETSETEHYENYEQPNLTWRRLTEVVVRLWNIVGELF
ncbi:hypothetical protein EG68_01697 [Paragonimus skrjabini miyazakii]|uniref:Secreted protein n=1 Tax=Paragonimus skrjabini miyazakii TaxID=59628 RepID=A0A8S9ZBU5_9TREM|nr:hypothetical protein EG68_01697 [Paragonimus skrjabini miyazakii]